MGQRIFLAHKGFKIYCGRAKDEVAVSQPEKAEQPKKEKKAAKAESKRK